MEIHGRIFIIQTRDEKKNNVEQMKIYCSFLIHGKNEIKTNKVLSV